MRLRAPEPVVEPALLSCAEHGPVPLQGLGAVRLLPRSVGTRLRGTEQSRIEHVHGEEIAHREAAVREDVRSARQLRAPQRQMLVPRLERRGAAQHEELRGRFLFVRVAGPVVLDLVIVVAHNERRGRVRGLQVRVELMQTVAMPVVVQRVALVRIAGHDAHDGQLALVRA